MADETFNFGSRIQGESTQPTGIQRAQLQYPLDAQSIQAIKRALEETSTFKTIQLEPREDIQRTMNKLSDEGGGIIQLAAGTYTLNNRLQMRSGIRIVGDHKSTTILDFNNTAANIVATGTNVYTTGTITSITGGVTVTGSGTLWLANATADQQFFIAHRWYEILSVNSDTSITLDEGYAGGATFPGASYRIATVVRNIEFDEITLKNSTGTALDLDDCRSIFIDDCTVIDNNKGIVADNCSEISSSKNIVTSQTSNGVELNTCGLTNIKETSTPANGGHGLVMNDVRLITYWASASSSNTIDGVNITTADEVTIQVDASSNTGQGVEVVSGATNLYFHECNFSSNTSDGLKFTATTDECKIIGCQFDDGSAYGLNIAAATCDNNIVSGCFFDNNTSGAINDAGTGTVIE